MTTGLKVIKQILLFLILMISANCAQNTIHSQQKLTTAQEVPTPTVTPTPFIFPKLSDSDSLHLNERLPKKIRQVLEQADGIELFEFKFCGGALEPKLDKIQPDKFQECDITKKAIITDASLKQQVLDGLYYSIGATNSGAACFSPRHGLRAIYKGKRVDLSICFQCANFDGVSNVGKLGGGISTAPKELFEQILANAVKK